MRREKMMLNRARERKKECDRIKLKNKRTLWLGDILVVFNNKKNFFFVGL